MNPTKEQDKVIKSERSLIALLAPHGTGKTETITWFVLKRFSTKKYKRIIIVTLTNSAADNMNDRLQQLNLPSLTFSVKAKTFHSFAKVILHKYADKIGYKKDFEVVPGISERLVKSIYNENRDRFKSLNNPFEVIKTVSEKYLRTNNRIIDIAQTEIKEIKMSIEIRKVVLSVQKRKRLLNVMDNDDLTFNFYKLVKDNRAIVLSIFSENPLMIVDEFQDTTNIQWKAMKILIENGIYFLAAGDPYQTLYRFARADPLQV